MRVLLSVLTVALIPLVSDPAQAQSAADDQYGSSGVGHDAAADALRASSALDDAPATEAAGVEEGAAFAAEIASAASDPEANSAEEGSEAEAADSEKGADVHVLPDTGGFSPLLLGVLLVCSGVVVRALAR